MLKQRMKGIQRSVGLLLAGLPVTPNQVTLLSILFAILSAWLVCEGKIVEGCVMFLLAGVMDGLDGAIARAKGMVTEFGGFIDGVVDRIVEGIFILSLMTIELPDVVLPGYVWLGALLLFGTCMPSFVRAYADHKHVVAHETALLMGGVFERTERVLMVVFATMIGYFFGWVYFVYLIIISVVLSLVTVLQRISIVWNNQKKNPSS